MRKLNMSNLNNAEKKYLLQALADEYNAVERLLEDIENDEKVERELLQWKRTVAKRMRELGSGVRPLRAQGLIS